MAIALILVYVAYQCEPFNWENGKKKKGRGLRGTVGSPKKSRA